MSEATIVCTGQDAERIAAELRRERIAHNVMVLGAGLAAGLPVELASLMCLPLEDREQEPPKAAELTESDKARIAAAEEKRQRKAAKRRKEPNA